MTTSISAPPARSPLVAVQLGIVWALGGLLLPNVYLLTLIMLFTGSGAVVVVALLAGTVGLVVLLWGTVRLTAPVTVLGSTPHRQLAWALLVFAAGTALWGFGWALTDEAGLGISDHQLLRPLFGGAAYALVAGLLLRGARRRLASGTVLAVLLGFGLVALARSGPTELTVRLAHANVSRELEYVVTIPGYRPVDTAYGDRLGTRLFVPQDESAIPPLRLITIVAYRETVTEPGPCGETALDSQLRTAECVREPGGLLYRRGVVNHGYQVRSGKAFVELVAPHSVDQQVLRDAVATLRPLSKAERARFDHHTDDLYTADVPEYGAQLLGIPPGVQLAPTDPKAAPQSVHITVDAVSHQEPCGLTVECVSSEEGLWYRRTAEDHGYVLRRGPVDVYAIGGLGVDRQFLRTVAFDARPATDAELLRALPPAPRTGPLDRLRRWLRGEA